MGYFDWLDSLLVLKLDGLHTIRASISIQYNTTSQYIIPYQFLCFDGCIPLQHFKVVLFIGCMLIDDEHVIFSKPRYDEAQIELSDDVHRFEIALFEHAPQFLCHFLVRVAVDVRVESIAVVIIACWWCWCGWMPMLLHWILHVFPLYKLFDVYIDHQILHYHNTLYWRIQFLLEWGKVNIYG